MRRRKAKKEELPPPPEPHTASTVSKFVNSPWLFLIWPYPLYKLLTLIYPGSSIMYTFFISLFVVLVVICVVVRTTFASPSDGSSTVSKSESFLAFQKNWLIVYFIVMGADWLQGPYVYALYEAYGFTKADIGILFIAGFLSSMIFGTFVGSLADKYGRKRLCIAFGVIYSLSCLTKVINDFSILFIGRILGGIATSLLFSAFESWMISEHNRRSFEAELISDTFSLATFGNGVVAIGAGLVATFVAEYSTFHYVAPFLVSLVFLVIGSVVVSSTWDENYGNSSIDVYETLNNAVLAMKQDTRIPVLGMIQSLFEAAMYTFVFMWTPALSAGATDADGNSVVLPFGLIFACYMVCIMIGSSGFNILCNKYKLSPEQIASMLLVVAGISLFIPVITSDMSTVLLSFLIFETCCGMYFPCMGTLRSKYIPEATRAAIMNFFRVPLNFFVVVVLTQVGDLENATVFFICTVWLATAWFLHRMFRGLTPPRTELTQ